MLDLHSTMQRLKPFCHARKFNIDCTFTFHYAKIKTPSALSAQLSIPDLHSTMQRLKRIQAVVKAAIYLQFTFHYAKIKTDSGALVVEGLLIFTFHYAKIKTARRMEHIVNFKDLHSTMQRLKHGSSRQSTYIFRFTFHYAKIKTLSAQIQQIKLPHLHSTMQRLKRDLL